MSKHPTISSAASQSASELHDFIKKYKKFLHAQFADVADGENMLHLGAKTAAIQNLEQWFANPIEGMLTIQRSAEASLKKAVEQLVVLFLKSSIESKFIKSAFLISQTSNSLSYGIVLYEDNFKNRRKIFKFLSLYYTFELSERIPVHFQFVPDKLKGAFKTVEYIV
ncbi:MAG TPA: hypothetical protein VIM64_18515 [Puia sp.]